MQPSQDPRVRVRHAQKLAAQRRTEMLKADRTPRELARLAPPLEPAAPTFSVPPDIETIFKPPTMTAAERAQLEVQAAHRKKMKRVERMVSSMESVGRRSLTSKQDVRGLAPKRDQPALLAEAAVNTARERLKDAASATALLVDKKTNRVRRDTNRSYFWTRFDGEAKLEPSLTPDTLGPMRGESPVRLVDSRFLIAIAQKRCTLPKRQEIPDEAFVPLAMLREMMPATTPGGIRSLRIAFVSSM